MQRLVLLMTICIGSILNNANAQADSNLLVAPIRPNGAAAYFSKEENHKVYVENCKLKNLPSYFEVYAIETYSGDMISEYVFGESDNVTTEIEVIVNKPNTPIVLALMAHDPVIWKVSRTVESKIIGVLVGGYYTQVLLGVPSSVPQVTANFEEESPCGYFYVGENGEGVNKAAGMIKGIAGQEVSKFINTSNNNKFYVGNSGNIKPSSLIYSTDRDIEDYIIPSGQRGLDKLVNLGKIRLATKNEINKWVERASRKYRKYNKKFKVKHNMYEEWTYMILDYFKLPKDLYGAHSRSFIIPENTQLPAGPRGHNSFYFMDSGECAGPSDECRN